MAWLSYCINAAAYWHYVHILGSADQRCNRSGSALCRRMPYLGTQCPTAEAAKMRDGGAAIMAKIAAAARAAGVTNPIDSGRAAIAERHRAELAAVAAAEAAKVRRRQALI